MSQGSSWLQNWEAVQKMCSSYPVDTRFLDVWLWKSWLGNSCFWFGLLDEKVTILEGARRSLCCQRAFKGYRGCFRARWSNNPRHRLRSQPLETLESLQKRFKCSGDLLNVLGPLLGWRGTKDQDEGTMALFNRLINGGTFLFSGQYINNNIGNSNKALVIQYGA